ncbi:hypothetical protein [Bathymodiolus thermophilus thioautotrophic gill symbiont]|uniref:hypothetical protein n=1 Tax=Bathymodiolus thermophilus thioautotrophic gill symbiont TaxID=2360 RepID=UPI003B9690FB
MRPAYSNTAVETSKTSASPVPSLVRPAYSNTAVETLHSLVTHRTSRSETRLFEYGS